MPTEGDVPRWREANRPRLTWETFPSGQGGAHAMGGSDHNPDTIQNIRTKCSDATIETTDGSAAAAAAAVDAHETAYEHGDLPTNDEKAALAGTSGAPSGTNKYVTDADARNTNARAPTAHGHPESDVTDLVTHLAAKEATANKGAVSGYCGLDGASKVAIGNIPTGATGTTVCIGDDARLSDARTPTSHDNDKHSTAYLAASEKGAASGVASLSASSQLVQAVASGAITDAKLRNSAACSVIGRAANSIGTPTDIAAAADGQVLSRAAGVVAFGSVPSHDQAATTITTGTLDGDRLPAMSTTKKGGVPMTGTPSGLFLRDDGTFAAAGGGAHDLGGASHNADTLANLNAKISDADVVALAGQIGGTAASPDVRGLRESGGGLRAMGAVADLQYLQWTAGGIIGAVPTAALPELVQTRMTSTADQTVTAGYAAYIPDAYEIASGFATEIGIASVMEVG